MMDIFTYGTLMDADIMSRVSGQTLECRAATLSGYVRKRMAGEAYPAILSDAESTVSGQLYRGVNTEAIQRLDAFEGDHYDRRVVTLKLENGEQHEAQVYALKDEFYHLASQDDWTLEWFLKHGKTDFMAYEGFDAI